MKQLKIPCLLALLLVTASGQESSTSQRRTPNNSASALERMAAGDIARQLSQQERQELVKSFVRENVLRARRGQSLSLSTTVPIYRLLKTNFPSLAEREDEAGISLGAITRYFNSLPEYRPIVELVLQEERKNGYCKK